jgi:UDP-N-acetylmuramate dehydrogenase
MFQKQRALELYRAIPRLDVLENVLLSDHTRFGIGGPAAIFAETADEPAFVAAIEGARSLGAPAVVIGGGTNLIVADAGFDGIVLKFTADRLQVTGTSVCVEAGAALQDLVDGSIAHGLARLHTMTGIPGSVGGAIYGNAGAYGHSISESVWQVRFFDGRATRTVGNAECEFRYRESVFKRRKEWILFSAELRLEQGDAAALGEAAREIREIRDRKYPPEMKCAGSIFKNLILEELPTQVRLQVPDRVVREGKVPSAFFLEEVGAKGMRNGDIHVADYHANLIYNAGSGTARALCEIIGELKSRVRRRFGLDLEEEVQYVGFAA